MPILLAPADAPALAELLEATDTSGLTWHLEDLTGGAAASTPLVDLRVAGIGTLGAAGPTELAFLSNPRAGSVASGVDSLWANTIDYEHSLRLTGIKTIPESELSFYAGFAKRSKSNNELTGEEAESRKSGQRLGIYHVTKGTLGGARPDGTADAGGD